ncbi:MAG: hypothetical protein ACI8ZX_000988 [Planctomycetota bacterium]|jgi:hypothetical protein
MKIKIILLVSFLSWFFINDSFSNYSDGVDVEMFLMRKGNNVKVVLISNGSILPSELEVERKSTAPLSKYRKVLTINGDQLVQFLSDKKLILTDNYPESRQLDSYYRISYITKEGVVKKLPAIFLTKASNENSVTFGDHKKDETMFETEEEKEILLYETHGLTFSVKCVRINILVTIAGGKNLVGSWFIERKSAKPLSSFRRIKTINDEDKALTMNGEHVFLDKYPESRKLDAYYRLLVILEDGEFLEFPSVFLAKTSNGKK